MHKIAVVPKGDEPSNMLLSNAIIIDVISGSGKKGSILIKNETIEDIQYSKPIIPPKNTIIYDLEGKFIIPGLIDGHVHISHDLYVKVVEDLEYALAKWHHRNKRYGRRR